ncbi:VRR-NUC domain-containing protein [Bacteroidetes/Chlorobi group bacterium Naka2016]|jgi:Holliday junction resolvase|nr:MAG: VRR-NUC domain-containing protein [Bacteroidetes/Chlorobi group bacterium Naka2016]
MKEQTLQSQIIRYLSSIGAYVVKVTMANRSGVPDIICCVDGRFIAIEVKTNSALTSLQKLNLVRIQRAGGIGVVAYRLGDVQDLVRNIRGENG